MSFVDRIVSSRSFLIRLVRAKNGELKAWWYIRVRPDKFEEYKVAVRADKINLTKYGEILYSGWGEEPPEDIKEKIEEL